MLWEGELTMDSQNSDQNRINDLITKLDNDDGFVREDARSVIIGISKEAVPSLTIALKSKNQRIRWEVAKALGAIADPAAIPNLIEALQDEVFDIRWLAAEALITTGRESVEPLLQAIINKSNESFLREGAHHVITYIMSSVPITDELTEILKPLKSALDRGAPRVIGTAAAEVALAKLKQLKKKQT